MLFTPQRMLANTLGSDDFSCCSHASSKPHLISSLDFSDTQRFESTLSISVTKFSSLVLSWSFSSRVIRNRGNWDSRRRSNTWSFSSKELIFWSKIETKLLNSLKFCNRACWYNSFSRRLISRSLQSLATSSSHRVHQECLNWANSRAIFFFLLDCFNSENFSLNPKFIINFIN